MIRAAARLMTQLEDEPHRLPELFRAVADTDGCRAAPPGCLLPRVVLGITGAPGSGKSTLADALVREYRQRHPDRRIGVIAVDPSSPFTGGAVLGDRVRMMRHATDPMVFVRSMATRGHLGGLTLGVRAVIRVMALIGCDVVMVETVGVGQSEIEVAGVADLVLIVLAPGQGDSIQLLKAGLMEIGDLFLVNKADRPEASRLHSYVLAMLKLGAAEAADLEHHADPAGEPDEAAPLEDPVGLAGQLALDRIEPRAYLVSAFTNLGVPALVDDLEALSVEQFDRWTARRTRIVDHEVREAVLEAARRRLDLALGPGSSFSAQVDDVLRGQVSVEDLAQDLLARTSRSRV
ncbi:MAG: methylmalonyl Co-A mutase-associated GTPase MeaB [Planctomycetes bacterium]|nr:methylmalonyl Co-A mutase-associated GTPase MeaB [Planctomycetota bacterium]